jgi:hypothetical protein
VNIQKQWTAFRHMTLFYATNVRPIGSFLPHYIQSTKHNNIIISTFATKHFQLCGIQTQLSLFQAKQRSASQLVISFDLKYNILNTKAQSLEKASEERELKY